MSKKLRCNSGFSLFEMLIAIFVFSLAMVIFGLVLGQSSGIQQGAFNMQKVQENSSFALELMAKEIRVSEVLTPDNNCPNTLSTTLTLLHPLNGRVVYSLLGTGINREVAGVSALLTSDEIDFTRLQFCVLGGDANDGRQPRITIVASVRSRSLNHPSTVDIQTTVSQRVLSN